MSISYSPFFPDKSSGVRGSTLPATNGAVWGVNVGNIPTNLSGLTGSESINNALIPSSNTNLVRLSMMELGTAGYGVLYIQDPATQTIVSPFEAGMHDGKRFVRATINHPSTPGVQRSWSIGSQYDVSNRMPIVGGQRYSVTALFEVVSANPLMGWQLRIHWLNAAGVFFDGVDIRAGTGSLPQDITEAAQAFVVAPLTARFAYIEFYGHSNGHSGNQFLLLSRPMVTLASATQTVHPAFTPGPSAEYGATVDASIIHENPVIVAASSTGVPKTGEITKNITFRLIRQGIQVTSGITWSAIRVRGNATHTMTGTGTGVLAITGPNDATFNAEQVFRVTSVYNGVSRETEVTIQRRDDPPTNSGGGGVSGGTSASTTILNDTAGDTYQEVAASAMLTVKAGSNGRVTCTAPIDFKRNSGSAGFTGAFGVWQFRPINGPYGDIGPEVPDNGDAQTYVDPEPGSPAINLSGNLNVTQVMTGLSNGVEYQFRFLWRDDGTARLIRVGGTLQAVGD